MRISQGNARPGTIISKMIALVCHVVISIEIYRFTVR